MKRLKWIGVFAMYATMACGGQNAFYTLIISGDGLLDLDDSIKYHPVSGSYKKLSEESKKTFCVSVLSSGQGKAPGQQRYDLRIDGTALSVALTNGIVVAMSRDGKDIDMRPSKFELSGDADWVALSLRYHAEAVKLLPFTHFLGVGEQVETNKISVIAQHVLPSVSRFVCGASGKMRTVDYYDDSTRIKRIIERQGKAPVPFVAFDDVEKLAAEWSVALITEFDKDCGCLTFISCNKGGFSADFFLNGGLKTLRIFDLETHEGISERKWNEKGELIHERDLKKDPYPDFDLKDARMLKGGREV